MLNKYESNKPNESFVSESDYAERVWDAAVKGYNYPEMDPVYENRVHIPSEKEVKTRSREYFKGDLNEICEFIDYQVQHNNQI